MKYLVNALSLNMFSIDNIVIGLYVKQMMPTDFCREIDDSVINAIGHQATAQLISTLCGRQISMNRVEVKINDKDELLVVQLLTRLPEGKILSFEEIAKLLNNGLIKLLKIKVRVTESSGKKYVIIKRVSDGFYSYVAKLYDASGTLIDEERCGDLTYWGREGEKSCADVVSDLLKRNSIDNDDVETYFCGGFHQPECPCPEWWEEWWGK